MKRLILILITAALAYPAFTQGYSTKLQESDKTTASSANRRIEMLETLEVPGAGLIMFEDASLDDISTFQEKEKVKTISKRSGRRFEGHWAGVELGFNNFLTADYSMVLPDDIYYLTLNTNRSGGLNLNFAQIDIGITRGIGFVTGLGLNMNDYVFEGNNSIVKGTNGIIESLSPDAGINYEKSKLTTRYITAPLMLEIQIPSGYSNRVHIAAGVIGAVKVGSHTKTVFYNEGVKQKVKDHSDFSLNMLRYGFTARAGYEMVQLFGTYYMTPLFKNGKGPELFPFEIGISFTIND
jgi:hypothetical protein